MEITECFKIRLLKIKDNNLFDIENAEMIYEIKYDRIKFASEPVSIVADPFLFVYLDTLFLFYEEKKLYHNGKIMMTKTRDLKHWERPKCVLKENFHLSYPWVFEHEGHIYMMPETSFDKSIRLYEAINTDLTNFKLKKVLINELQFGIKVDNSFVDSSIYQSEDLYYLSTSVCRNGKNQSLLFMSENLIGPYKEHPMSPMEPSMKLGRNAGCWFNYNNMLFRVAQDCVNRYGDNVNVLLIEELSSQQYSEKLIKENIIPVKVDFYRHGGHHFNYIKFKGDIIIATDAKEYYRYFWNRVLHKLNFY